MESLDLEKLPVLSMSDEETAEFIRNRINEIIEVADLDTIRICATSMKDGTTHYFSYGRGNMYAQVGAVQEWLAAISGSDDGGFFANGMPLDDDDEDDDELNKGNLGLEP
jgi:hypothetical protein